MSTRSARITNRGTIVNRKPSNRRASDKPLKTLGEMPG